MAKKKQTRKVSRKEMRPVVKDAKGADISFSYRDYDELTKFISDRAKIYSRKKTGLTAKQQRSLTTAVKRARHLGLLPFKPQI